MSRKQIIAEASKIYFTGQYNKYWNIKTVNHLNKQNQRQTQQKNYQINIKQKA
jgi:hypothetical protein